jgi:hypothetical protein
VVAHCYHAAHIAETLYRPAGCPSDFRKGIFGGKKRW